MKELNQALKHENAAVRRGVHARTETSSNDENDRENVFISRGATHKNNITSLVQKVRNLEDSYLRPIRL
jgi:hypothetical protein